MKEMQRHYTEDRFEENVLGVLKFQMALYPRFSLIDIYKSFFQDEFGPGHLLVDVKRAKMELHDELCAMRSRRRRIVEPCGMGYQFCRVPLDLVVDGIIDEKDYFSAFFAGATASNLPETECWKRTWIDILEVVKLKRKCISDFGEDSEFIMESLEKGTWTMNHSDQYRKLYDPHYRIFSVEQQWGILLGK